MTNEAITKLIESHNGSEKALNIHFKQRTAIIGKFVKGYDYRDLKAKNLWRIVTERHFEAWDRTKDIALAKIFNGVDFTRLVEVGK
jgi:hypothetical protein